MKKALITGITGQDGSFLAELLLAKGYEVHGLVRRASSLNTERIDHLYQDPSVHGVRFFLHYGDLNDASSIQSVVEKILPNEIYNLAAQSHVRVSFDVPEYTAEITGLGTLRVLEAIRNLDLSCKFYQASSSELFGKVCEIPQRETTPFHPRSPYAAAKAYGYYITQNYREAYSIFACNGILFNHESERRGENFVTRKITRAVGRIKYGLQKELKLGNLDAKRDWGYAADYVEAMWLMLQQPEPDDFVIGTGQTRSVREFLDLAFSYAGLDPKDFVQIDPQYFRPAEVELLLADASKARQKLGWAPKVSFEEMVRRMVERDLLLAEQECRAHENGVPHYIVQAVQVLQAVQVPTTSEVPAEVLPAEEVPTTSPAEEVEEVPTTSPAEEVMVLPEVPTTSPETPEEKSSTEQPRSQRAELTQEARELDERRIRHAVYDVIAEWRLPRLEKQRAFRQEMERLIASLVPPGASVLDVGTGPGDLLAALRPSHGVGIDISPRMIESAKERHPGYEFMVADVECDPLPPGPFDTVLLCDALGHMGDIQRALQNLRAVLDENGRIVITHDNILWEPALKVAEKLKIRAPFPDQNRLSLQDIENLLYISGFEVVRSGSDLLLPAHIPIASDVFNGLAAHLPGLRKAALVQYCIARPMREPPAARAFTVSVVCPVYNQRDHLRAIAARLPAMGRSTELLFVDCESTDDSAAEMEAIAKNYQGPLTIRALMSAKHPRDAITKGFAASSGEMLMILDANLNVPPEDMPRFYDALAKGKGDFINGVRFIYRAGDGLQVSLDRMGSQFLSSILSWLFEQPVKDSMCAAKAMMRRDYERMSRIAEQIGIDQNDITSNAMDLLLGAARLNLKITDLPVRHRPRAAGAVPQKPMPESRKLLRMTAKGFQKLRLG